MDGFGGVQGVLVSDKKAYNDMAHPSNLNVYFRDGWKCPRILLHVLVFMI